MESTGRDETVGWTLSHDFPPAIPIPPAQRLPGRSSDGGLSEGYGHGGPGVCLGDGQTEACLKDTGMTGLASVWAMARRRPI